MERADDIWYFFSEIYLSPLKLAIKCGERSAGKLRVDRPVQISWSFLDWCSRLHIYIRVCALCCVYALQKIDRCTRNKKRERRVKQEPNRYEHKKTILNKRLCFKNCLRERDINFKKLNLQNIL